MPNTPLISVVMPVRNGMPFVADAIESVLNQTFIDFEFIVVDDGSTDATPDLLHRIIDPRLIIITTPGIGLVASLNLGLAQVRGQFFTRMDADDICSLDRFEVQAKFLLGNHHIGLVCSDVVKINENGLPIGCECDSWSSQAFIKKGLLGQSKMKPIIHPTVMLRTELIKQAGGYRDYAAAEDRDLWLRLIDKTNFSRISKPLLSYRVNPNGVSHRQRFKQQINSSLAVFNSLFLESTGVDLYHDEPQVWSLFGRFFAENLRCVASGMSSFEHCKSEFRSKRYLRFFILSLIGYLRYRYSFLPMSRQKYINECYRSALELGEVYLTTKVYLKAD